MNTSKTLRVFSLALSFATAANANGHFFLNESNYCASSDDIVLRLGSWPIQFGPVDLPPRFRTISNESLFS